MGRGGLGWTHPVPCEPRPGPGPGAPAPPLLLLLPAARVARPGLGLVPRRHSPRAAPTDRLTDHATGPARQLLACVLYFLYYRHGGGTPARGAGYGDAAGGGRVLLQTEDPLMIPDVLEGYTRKGAIVVHVLGAIYTFFVIALVCDGESVARRPPPAPPPPAPPPAAR